MNLPAQTVEQLLPDFETAEDVFERQAEIIKALERQKPASTKLTEEAANLAEKLRECANGWPCNLSMCPICVRELRESYVLAAKACIDKLQSTPRWGPLLPITAFQGIPLDDQYPPGTLFQMKLTAFNEKMQTRHRRAGFPLVFAGIDISWNVDNTPQKDPPFWQAQVYGVVVGLDVDAVKSGIESQYPRAASILRPLRVRECTDLPEAVSYTIKPGFVTRVSYIDKKGRRNSWNYDLKPPELREMALWLGRYELSVRYALTGCRRYIDRIDLNPGVRKRLKKLALELNRGLV